jgi:hypothetical protein
MIRHDAGNGETWNGHLRYGGRCVLCVPATSGLNAPEIVRSHLTDAITSKLAARCHNNAPVELERLRKALALSKEVGITLAEETRRFARLVGEDGDTPDSRERALSILAGYVERPKADSNATDNTERRDSVTPVAEPAEPDPFYKMEQYRAKVGDCRIAISRTGPKEWCWHTASVLVQRSASGEKPTFAEAAQAALDAMRGLK